MNEKGSKYYAEEGVLHLVHRATLGVESQVRKLTGFS